MENFKLDVRLRHNKPVDLIDMANSLISLNHIAISQIGQVHGIKDTKIMLDGVKEGCDIYQLSFIFSHLMPVVESVNTIASFTEHIKRYITLEKLPVEQIKKDDNLNTKDAQLIEEFVKPVLADVNSSISIELNGNNNNIVLNINNNEAKKIKENVGLVKQLKKEKSQEEDKTPQYFKKVLIKLHSTTDTQKKVKDKAYCDDILKGKAVSTIFESIEDKKEVLNDPYNNYFLVDIDVQRIDGVPKLYRVIKVHDIIPI